VPVERIAKSYLDLFIDDHDDLRAVPGAPGDRGRLSGLIIPTTRTIWLDRAESNRNPRRRRFTIAHEIGHWRMHCPTGISEVLYDRPQDIAEEHEHPELRPRETEANAFAGELLMPELLVREQAETTGCNLSALSERFDVSVPAIRLRLRLLGVLPAWMR
jgi:predicted transcriptional regulator